MSIQILIDMNLSPDWVNELSKHGWASVHWSTIGDPKAIDREIMDRAEFAGGLPKADASRGETRAKHTRKGISMPGTQVFGPRRAELLMTELLQIDECPTCDPVGDAFTVPQAILGAFANERRVEA